MAAPVEPLEAGASRLLQLAELIAAGAGAPDPTADGTSGVAVLLRLRSDESQPCGFELGAVEVDGRDGVYEVLDRFVAPADWFGVGLVVDGWERRMLPDGQVSERRGRVRSVVLMTRDGCEASVLLRPGHEPLRLSAGPGSRQAQGAMADLLRRVLRLDGGPTG